MHSTTLTTIHIFVEVENFKPPVKVEFETDDVTGAEIKNGAHVPLTDDLAKRVGDRLEQVTNDQRVTIKNGEHFVALPPGTISWGPMNDDVMARLISELKEAFPDAVSAVDGPKALVRIPDVPLPKGCKPESIECLVVLTAGAAQPELFVRSIPLRPDGGVPRSTGTTTIAGEAWCTFSFGLSWDVTRHTAEQFVHGRLQRFAKNE
jgi:hypothetical protein